MKRVFITGAAGFTGSYAVPLARARGFEVHAPARRDCDVRDRAALRAALLGARPHYVLHLAGSPNLPDSQLRELRELNITGTANLLEACGGLADMPEKIVLASSGFIYGDSGGERASEDAAAAPRGAYGRSKLEMERVAAAWTARLPIVIARPFNYTGVGHGERFLVPKLVQAFRERASDVSFVDPNAVRDYSDVRWVAEVYLRLLESTVSGIAVNVCSGIATPLPDIVARLERLTGHAVAKAARRREERAPRTALVGDASRLSALLGYPSPYTLDDTLRWMLGRARHDHEI